MPAQKNGDSILISLICNALLMLGKGIAGVLANSNALVADAIHSLTDVGVFLLNYRACSDCQVYRRIDKNRSSEHISRKLAETELRATCYTGMVFLTTGIAICLYNLMILVLGKVERPDAITVLVALIALAVYAGLYKYLRRRAPAPSEACVLTGRNADWQNEMNLLSGSVVLVGLAGSLLGFSAMDELAAVVVGSILVAMGAKLLVEIGEDVRIGLKVDPRVAVVSSIVVSIALAAISLAIRL
jgi:divalent metal cation (Fe/Co/Zn/Cd) transporter